MPAVPVGASLAASRRSLPSASHSARASCPPASRPSAQANSTPAPARRAATAWLKPLPPGPVAYSPPRVAPGCGRLATRQTWSTLNEPTTATRAISGVADVAGAVRGHDLARVVAVAEQRHEQHRHRQRVQRERGPDAVPVLGAAGVGVEAVDHPAADGTA